MKYDFKVANELVFAGLTAVGVFVLQLALDFDADTVTDWQAYLVAAGSGAVRAAAGALLAALGRQAIA